MSHSKVARCSRGWRRCRPLPVWKRRRDWTVLPLTGRCMSLPRSHHRNGCPSCARGVGLWQGQCMCCPSDRQHGFPVQGVCRRSHRFEHSPRGTIDSSQPHCRGLVCRKLRKCLSFCLAQLDRSSRFLLAWRRGRVDWRQWKDSRESVCVCELAALWA